MIVKLPGGCRRLSLSVRSDTRRATNRTIAPGRARWTWTYVHAGRAKAERANRVPQWCSSRIACGSWTTIFIATGDYRGRSQFFAAKLMLTPTADRLAKTKKGSTAMINIAANPLKFHSLLRTLFAEQLGSAAAAEQCSHRAEQEQAQRGRFRNGSYIERRRILRSDFSTVSIRTGEPKSQRERPRRSSSSHSKVKYVSTS